MSTAQRKTTNKGSARSRVIDTARPQDILRAARIHARAWSAEVPDRRRQAAAWSLIAEALGAYVRTQGRATGHKLALAPLRLALTYSLDPLGKELADIIGQAAASLPIDQASYHISATYTVMLPPKMRSDLGIYYTPASLTERLLDMAEEAGTDWRTATVLDPACGGGAFLLPVALRIQKALDKTEPRALLRAMGTQLSGFEIDPFAAWMTQAWLEIAFAEVCNSAKQPFPTVVTVCDSLEQATSERHYDLVIGNPPYGRVTLPPQQRNQYKRSLYGHANLYGVFTDLALRLTKQNGNVAYVTPTSFLAGEYFKALRTVLADEAPPAALDFIHARRGIFEDVLQETALAVYKKGGKKRAAAVHYLEAIDDSTFALTETGQFSLPQDGKSPWLAPRQPEQKALTARLTQMATRLADWGYTVSTGPLVWNRFKSQLHHTKGRDRYPLIWAEAVTSTGQFIYRAEKRNHAPYFEIKPGDEWLLVNRPCVLVQRTTAKEQARRLIAAELDADFIAKHRKVVVENHLNMVRPINGEPKVPASVVAAVLNSEAVDQAFRCISGSVAVSAYELEALPLPAVDDVLRLVPLLSKGDLSGFGKALRALYTSGLTA